ncbi:MAG: hypothetical protein ACP5RS_06990 [Thermoplasmata archaeon]
MVKNNGVFYRNIVVYIVVLAMVIVILPIPGIANGLNYSKSQNNLMNVNFNARVNIVKKTFSPNYIVNFTETGLPANTPWKITFDNITKSSTNPSIIFSVPNGTYYYKEYFIYYNGTGYVPTSQQNGVANIYGNYSSYVFYELSTRAAQPKYVFNGSYSNYNISGKYNSYPFSGTDNLYINSVNLTTQSFNDYQIMNVYKAQYTNTTDTFSYTGAYMGLNVTTLNLLNNGSIPTPPGTSIVDNVSVTVPAGTFQTDEISYFNSTNTTSMYSTIWVDRYSGIYVKAQDQINGTINMTEYMELDKTNVPMSSKYSSKVYEINFIESGLSVGTNWSISLNGTMKSSTNTTITFVEPNGTYSYKVGNVSEYKSNILYGNVTVNGNNAYVHVTFTRSVYNVSFIESGLARGTNWSVTIGTKTISSTSSSIYFMLPPGNYTYTVSPIKGYVVTPSKGSISLNGNNAYTYSINFIAVQIAPQPVYAYNGSYAYYDISGSINETANYTVNNVNVTLYNFNVYASMSSQPYHENSTSTFADPGMFPAVNVSVLNSLNKGILPKEIGPFTMPSNATLLRNVSVTVPAGTFITDEIKTNNMTIYIQTYSGIVVKFIINSSYKETMVLARTNIPTGNSNHSSTTTTGTSVLPGMSNMVMILLLVAVIVVVALVAFMFTRKKKGKEAPANNPGPEVQTPK